MAGPAPTEIQHIDQQEADLYNKMAPPVEQATGQLTPPASLKPEDNSPLKAIEGAVGDTTHVVGSTVDEWIGGASDAARVRTTEGKIPTAIAAYRRLKQTVMKKAA